MTTHSALLFLHSLTFVGKSGQAYYDTHWPPRLLIPPAYAVSTDPLSSCVQNAPPVASCLDVCVLSPKESASSSEVR